VDCSIKKADQNGVQDERVSASPCSERSIDKEAQEMVAALELRIKEEPEDEENEEEEEDRAEEEDICDSGLRVNGETCKVKSGETLLSNGCMLHPVMPVFWCICRKTLFIRMSQFCVTDGFRNGLWQ
jgi:hypothetical protein